MNCKLHGLERLGFWTGKGGLGEGAGLGVQGLGFRVSVSIGFGRVL